MCQVSGSYYNYAEKKKNIIMNTRFARAHRSTSTNTQFSETSKKESVRSKNFWRL